MSKHYRITSGDKMAAIKKKPVVAGTGSRPSGLGMTVSPSGLSTQSTQSNKSAGGASAYSSKISSLQQDLFAKLEKATNKPGEEEIPLDSLDRLEMLGLGGDRDEEPDKYEYLASLGKNHVNSHAGDDFQAQKQSYLAAEQKRKREEKKQQKRKVLSQVPKDQDRVILTGAGLEQYEAEDDDDDEPVDPAELRDDVGGLYELEDQEMIDLMNECLDEVKRDCLKIHRGEEDDLAEIRRLIKEVDAEKNIYRQANSNLSKKLIGMRTGLTDAGCKYDAELFDKIERQSSKMFGASKPALGSISESQEDRSTSKKGLQKALSSDSNGPKRKKFS